MFFKIFRHDFLSEQTMVFLFEDHLKL